MIYLDNAATSGRKPVQVIKEVEDGLKFYSANPGRGGHKLSVNSAMKVFGVRGKIKDYFHCNGENEVCFTPNCTFSINTVLYGTLKQNDHVIVSDLEHNAVMRPLYALKKELNLEVSILNVSLTHPEGMVKELEKLIKSNTKLVVLTHSSNVTGTVLPIKEVGEICNKYGILFCVDSAQSAGHIDINVKDMNIDFLCIAPHKGLYAPMGTGILICRKPLDRVMVKGGTGVNSLSVDQPDDYPERIESGTVNLPGILGIGAGIDFVSKREIITKINNEVNLIEYLYTELKKAGAIIYSSNPKETKITPVFSFNILNHSSEEVALYLSDNSVCVRGGLHCAPLAHKKLGTLSTGAVRVSTSVFSTLEQIERVIFLAKKFQKMY